VGGFPQLGRCPYLFLWAGVTRRFMRQYAFTIPLHERLSFFQTARGASQWSRRRRRRLSPSSSDGEGSGRNGVSLVPRHVEARALGRKQVKRPLLGLSEKIIPADG